MTATGRNLAGHERRGDDFPGLPCTTGRGWTVVNANCLDVMRGMEPRSVAHVIADPPYESEAHTKGRRIKSGAKQPRAGGGGA